MNPGKKNRNKVLFCIITNSQVITHIWNHDRVTQFCSNQFAFFRCLPVRASSACVQKHGGTQPLHPTDDYVPGSAGSLCKDPVPKQDRDRNRLLNHCSEALEFVLEQIRLVWEKI